MTETEVKEEPSPKKESLADEIKTAVREVLGSLLDSGSVTVEDSTDTSPSSTKTETKPPTPREEERSMEELVRAEVEKLKQVTPSEPTKQSSLAETPPNTTSRKIEKYLWGIGK
jgi:hypothetical protein